MFARVLLLAALWCVLSGTAADNVTAVFGTLARVSRSRPSHLSFAPAPNPARFGSQPPPRVGSVAALTDNGTAVVFGGVLPSGALAAPDVWEYNAGAIATKSQSCPECTEQRITSPALDRWACLCDSSSPVFPPPRTGHTATYSQGKLVVYGGRDAAGELLRSVWVFDTCAHLLWPAPLTCSVLTLFTTRSGHCLA
jgi:ribosomal protein S27AE